MADEREHEHEPAPAPAVQAAPAATGAYANPFAGAGRAPGAITPAQALALQRGAGNQAVSRLIARQAAQPPPAGTAPGASAATNRGLKHGEFTPTDGEPRSSGSVTATAQGADMINVSAPDVDADGGVTWNKRQDPAAGATPTPPAGGTPAQAPAAPAGGGAAPGAGPPPDEARIGWLNTLLSGDRVYTYTEDGTPSGKLVREVHMMGPSGGRDAMFDNDKRTGKQVPHSSSEAPFYGPAKRIRPNGEEVKVEHFHDQPGAAVRRQLEGPDGKKGKLAKISGADKFRLSLGVAEVDNPSTIHLTAKEWTVPWDVAVDQQGTGSGGAVSFSKFAGNLEDIKRGEGYVVGEAAEFPWPQTPDEVKTFSTQELINAIPYAERLDVGSWMLMCQELRARNPTCTITTRVDKSAGWIWDDLQITINGPRTTTKNATEGASAVPVTFRLLEICDPQDLKSGLSVQILVSVEGSKPQPMDWPWPFGPLRETRYWWDSSGANKGEWVDPGKGVKRDIQTDITIVATGFS